jgi:hypothetical protein
VLSEVVDVAVDDVVEGVLVGVADVGLAQAGHGAAG